MLCSFALFSTSHAQQASLRQTLNNNVNTIKQHECAKTASLKVVDVAETHQYALTKDDRIAGYPLMEELLELDKEKSKDLADIILDHNNYADIRQRCQNKFLYGIRFNKGNKKIEVAIGVPCSQVLVVFQDKGETKWWGGVFGNMAMEQVLNFLVQETP